MPKTFMEWTLMISLGLVLFGTIAMEIHDRVLTQVIGG